MVASLQFPVSLAPDFWAYVISMLSTTAGSVPAPLKGCILGLSTNPLNFSSSSALAASIALPGYHGYANSAGADFGSSVDNPDGSFTTELPSVLFRQSSGGTTLASGIAGLWLFSPAASLYCGGCNFPRALPIVNVGDGFAVLLELMFGSLTTFGKAVVIGSDALASIGGGGAGGRIIPGTVQQQTFSSAGTFAFVTGPNTHSIRFQGTGGSAGTPAGGGSKGDPGSGGGAYTDSIVPVLPSTSYNVVVGAAGLGANSLGSVTPGGDSSFGTGPLASAKGSNCTADGGAGGIGGLASAGVGLIKFNGGNGGAVVGTVTGGSGGGSSAGPGGPGANGVNSTGATGSAGGAALAGAGAGGNGGDNNVVGSVGGIPGGGPGGPGANATHIDGQPGKVILSWIV